MAAFLNTKFMLSCIENEIMTFNLKKLLCAYQRFFVHLVMIRNDQGKKPEKPYILIL